MPWVAAAAIGGAVIGGVSSNNAANKQVQASNNALNQQQQMFNIMNSQQAPYRSAGGAALNQLQYLTGTIQKPNAPVYADFVTTNGNRRDQFQVAGAPDPLLAVTANALGAGKKHADTIGFDKVGWDSANKKYQEDLANYSPGLSADDPNSLMHKFGTGDLNSNLAPNWAFALDQGQRSAQNMGNASGGLLSGNTMKGLQDYTINKSGDLYQNAFSNYTANQSNIFNRLASIAGLGQTANQQSIQMGVPMSQSMAGLQTGIGQAQASGIVGGANAISGGLSNAGGWYGLNNMNSGNNSWGNGSLNGSPVQMGGNQSQTFSGNDLTGFGSSSSFG